MTPEQITAFTKYVTWMVNHFRGRVEYYEIWNEPNIDYSNYVSNPEDYGKLFKTSAAAIHGADPNAKAVFGGLAGADVDFAKRALDAWMRRCDRCFRVSQLSQLRPQPEPGSDGRTRRHQCLRKTLA